MTPQQQERLIKIALNCKSRNITPHVHPQSMTDDGRSQRRVMRQLVEDGYLSQTGDVFTLTLKIYNEIIPEPVDLIELWKVDRPWNSNYHHDFVLVSELTPGQQKTLFESSGSYNWYAVRGVPLNYKHEFQDGDVLGPIVPHYVIPNNVPPTRSYSEYELVVKTAELEEYVKNAKREKEVETAYRENLPWALEAFDIITPDESQLIICTDKPGWLTSKTNLGVEPEKWGSEILAKMKGIEEEIQRKQERLRLLAKIDESVKGRGGWEIFRNEVREKVKEELN